MKPQSLSPQAPSPQKPAKPAVIATRKTCDASGTGLSHYVLMDKEVRR